ncbi:MAG: hypothetical protein FWG42_06630 [Clostridiales bacterium]|nr:hypothetical protein [Clostridiales bacterium]
MKKKTRVMVLVLLLISIGFLFYEYNVDTAENKNNFIELNESACKYLGRSFYANGVNGYVSIIKAPDYNSEILKIMNSKTLFIEYVYENDWGFVTAYPSEQSEEWVPFGWVKMDQLLVQYDCVAFEDEHLDEFYPYNGDYSEIKNSKSVVTWQWPGSGIPHWIIDDWDWNIARFSVCHAYNDEQNREWGFIPCLGGGRNIWVCLSEPQNADIPAFNPAPSPTAWQPKTANSAYTVYTKFKRSTGEGKRHLPTSVFIIAVIIEIITSYVLGMDLFYPNTKRDGKDLPNSKFLVGSQRE